MAYIGPKDSIEKKYIIYGQLINELILNQFIKRES